MTYTVKGRRVKNYATTAEYVELQLVITYFFGKVQTFKKCYMTQAKIAVQYDAD